MPLWEFLDRVWYPSIRGLDAAQAKKAALYSYTTALKSGMTTVNDMYRALDGLADAAAVTGIRAVLSNDVALPEHRLDTVEDNVQAFLDIHGHENGRIRVSMGLEWLPLSDLDLVKEIGQKRKELGMGLHIHLCESLTEVKDASDRFGGKTPVWVA